MTERDEARSERVTRNPWAGMTDAQLVAAARHALPGDHRAFTELVRRYQDHVVTNCRFLTGPAEADDAAQGVLLRAYRGLEGFRSDASFRTWLDRIKANHCANVRQKAARRRRWEAQDAVIPDFPVAAPQESIPARVADEALVRRTLDALPEKLRVALVLADMDGMPYPEIADVLGIGLSAVKMRVTRARRAFRDALNAEGVGDDGGPAF